MTFLLELDIFVKQSHDFFFNLHYYILNIYSNCIGVFYEQKLQNKKNQKQYTISHYLNRYIWAECKYHVCFTIT